MIRKPTILESLALAGLLSVGAPNLANAGNHTDYPTTQQSSQAYGLPEVQVSLVPGIKLTDEGDQIVKDTLERRIRSGIAFLAGQGRSVNQDTVRCIVGDYRAPDRSPQPFFYHFPDRTIRASIDFSFPYEGGELEDFIAIEDLAIGEIIHELEHLIQDQEDRFPELERAKRECTNYPDILGFIIPRTEEQIKECSKQKGIDPTEYARQLAQAELEAGQIEREYWISRYGENPENPDAAAWLEEIDKHCEHHSKKLGLLSK